MRSGGSIRAFYSAGVRAQAGAAEAAITPRAEGGAVAALIEGVAGRGDGYAEALADLSVVRVAVNQEYARLDHPVGPDDEVALFPPVTGGKGR